MFGPERTATGRSRHERREPVAGRRVEALREAEHRRAAGQRTRRRSPKAALGTATTTRFASAIGASSTVAASIPRQVDARQVARDCAPSRGSPRPARGRGRRASRRDRGRRGARERRAPRATADDDDVHAPSSDERWKSIDTGTPCELEARAQLVLDPVAVVARDEPRVVDEDAEPRRPRAGLRRRRGA